MRTAEQSLEDHRTAAADAALAAHDFGDEIVTDTGRWDRDGDCWTCDLALDGELADECASYHRAFVVRFRPGTATVADAHAGDIREREDD